MMYLVNPHRCTFESQGSGSWRPHLLEGEVVIPSRNQDFLARPGQKAIDARIRLVCGTGSYAVKPSMNWDSVSVLGYAEEISLYTAPVCVTWDTHTLGN